MASHLSLFFLFLFLLSAAAAADAALRRLPIHKSPPALQASSRSSALRPQRLPAAGVDNEAAKIAAESYMKWVERAREGSMRMKVGRGYEDDGGKMSMTELEVLAAESPAVAAGAALVLMREERIIRVGSSADDDFQTVQAAVDSVPKSNTQRTIILISAGTYREKVKIPKTKPFITFQGEGMDKTKITWHDTANSSNSTFKSATVSVMANGFVARNLAFENSAPAPHPGAIGAQAVAFQISGDKSSIYDCAFYGAQDTLYDHKGRHYFKNCLIQGSIDFIFGDGQSLYEGCEMRTLGVSAGSVTAQKRKKAGEKTGFAFVECKVTGAGMVYLGRAWGAYSRVVYIHTYIDNLVLPGAWNDWGIPPRQKTSFYVVYDCYGPGADLHNEVAWAHQLTYDQAAPFMSISFIDGQTWLASTS